eukprot:TRINITY_DN4790_c0_g1_i3.p1 TRINITY_DN4790_c0_g1~~TRINITY_DN4790_c0_g1_i3.p1  ORF type:complete len:645 (+),score=172.11 TRINITY_DN4790_c0_g1_i3:1939-3873(+)
MTRRTLEEVTFALVCVGDVEDTPHPPFFFVPSVPMEEGLAFLGISGAIFTFAVVVNHRRQRHEKKKPASYKLPNEFGEGGRTLAEAQMQARWVLHMQAQLEQFGENSSSEDFCARVAQSVDIAKRLLEHSGGHQYKYGSTEDKILKYVISEFNLKKRLRVSARDTLPELVAKQDTIYRHQGRLLPPPTPVEFIDENNWKLGDGESDETKWVGHGYFWKSSESDQIQNYLGDNDFDGLEDNFCRLKKASVLFADYDIIRQDFDLTGLSDSEINTWLLENAAYISEGQVSRIRPEGDMQKYLEPFVLEDMIDLKTKKSAIRLKGGGRVSIFMVGNEYEFDKDGWFLAKMLDVKGVGTSKLQLDADVKASGFLSAVDAFKEMAFQRMIQRIADIDSQIAQKSHWGTVRYLAIIDTGFKFPKEKANPATGYKGDRCVLAVRQRHSRLVASCNDVVYYSVAGHAEVFDQSPIKEMRESLTAWGVSSEQEPRTLFGRTCSVEELKKGDWNVQTTAPKSHFVDFSHFFALPSSKLPKEWKMSQSAVSLALRAGHAHMSTFNEPGLLQLAFGTSSADEAKRIFEEELTELEKKFRDFGKIGSRKPYYCWSWFLEADDSPVMDWAMEQGCNFEGHKDPRFILKQVESWLPKLN